MRISIRADGTIIFPFMPVGAAAGKFPSLPTKGMDLRILEENRHTSFLERGSMVMIRDAGRADIAPIVDIYNESVLASTASFDTTPKSVDDYSAWFSAHGPRFPVIVAQVDNVVVGWASLSRWSDRAAYDRTAEVSVYIRRSHWNRGIGRSLFRTIIDRGQAAGLHTVVSRIAEGNQVSVHLHESVGFLPVGIIREVGYKFDRYLDVIMMQLVYVGTGSGKKGDPTVDGA